MAKKLFLITLVAFAALLSAPATRAEPPASGISPIIEDVGKLLDAQELSDIRGVNYIHTTADDVTICPNLQFGQDSNCPWNMDIIRSDLDRLHAVGVNTVRIFLNYYTFGGASLTNPEYKMDAALEHLDAFIDAANIRGIYVMPVLLSKYPQDRFGPEYYETALNIHVRPVVQHLAHRKGIIAWDLFNEPDIGSPVDERCWDWGNADFPLCFPLANERIHFLRAVREAVRAIDPIHPITISLAFAKNYAQPLGTDLYVADLVEFFSFHYYDNDPYDCGRYAQHWYYGQGFPTDLQRAMDELLALNLGKPIVVSEIGFPTGDGHLRTYADLRRDLTTSFQLVNQNYRSGVILWPFQVQPEELVGDLYRSAH